MYSIENLDHPRSHHQQRRAPRLIEGRRRGASWQAPPLHVLLLKLRVWAEGVERPNGDAVDRYRARVQVVAKIAAERGERRVERSLDAFDLELQRVQTATLTELSSKHLRAAMAALN